MDRRMPGIRPISRAGAMNFVGGVSRRAGSSQATSSPPIQSMRVASGPSIVASVCREPRQIRSDCPDAAFPSVTARGPHATGRRAASAVVVTCSYARILRTPSRPTSTPAARPGRRASSSAPVPPLRARTQTPAARLHCRQTERPRASLCPPPSHEAWDSRGRNGAGGEADRRLRDRIFPKAGPALARTHSSTR
jgi:hypothetical protein